MTIIIIVAIIYAVCKVCSSSSAKKQEHDRKVDVERLKLEQTRIREEWKARVAEAKVETDRMIAIEREQLRQAKELEKHEQQLQKHEEMLQKMQFQLDQACEDIDNILYKIDELQKYSEYLQDQRDKCVENGAEYFKWQNKLSTVDDKIYRLNKQKAKATFLKEQAQRKLAS